ncbi:MAG: GMC family oxidoreductase [Moraxellaceae bacterium]|nr:GMC family oxidoreductase [Moraxellaceae bacterium]MBP8852641.1 GMC family oxidoreductase [Moraxellaceae bacterium]MCC6199662.1 GMC family oxidoreductase [Moraxellaceae bacterium]HQV40384.1 GMC family oxidoreductase [Moraxellaceae bacterium]HQX90514.1 GMC family oxidoreductase [Moraxellaceae bacterium]
MIYRELPQDGLPVTQAKDIRDKEVHLKADVIIVGSGAGGAVAAYELARTGKSVIVLEAGRYVPSSDFKEDMTDTMYRMYQDAGLQTNSTGDVILLQGATTGGSTVVSATISARIPDRVLKEWGADHGLENLSPEQLRPHFEKLEERLGVHINEPHEINDAANLIVQGAEVMGWSWKPLSRNVKQCALTGHCLAGCPSDRKLSMLVTYLPWAIAEGAEIFVDAHVDFVTQRNGRASGVEGRFIDPDTKQVVSKFTAEGQIVVMGAGPIQTPLLLQKSGMGRQSGMVGRNLSIRPGVSVFGKFSDPVYGWRGALTGVHVDEFWNEKSNWTDMDSGVAAPAQLVSQGELGEGDDHIRFMKEYKYFSALNVFVHDHGQGFVQWIGDPYEGDKRIEWNLNRDEFNSLRDGLRRAGRVMFAAGAEKVYLPSYNRTAASNVFELDQAVDKITFGSLGLYTMRMIAYNPQGTCRMGKDPFTSVVNPWGESHELKGLFVVDASIMPTEITVNTQMTVSALASYIVENIIKREASYFWS